MRRFLSITTIAALISPMASPLIATACPHAGPPSAGQRTEQQKPHCPEMAMSGHHHESPLPASEQATVRAGEPAGNCPMDCCIPGHPRNATTTTSAPELPPLAVVERVSRAIPVVFTCRGFSSHTDRGPPTA
jgi:uncharacterized protein involved in copper resistance